MKTELKFLRVYTFVRFSIQNINSQNIRRVFSLKSLTSKHMSRVLLPITYLFLSHSKSPQFNITRKLISQQGSTYLASIKQKISISFYFPTHLTTRKFDCFSCFCFSFFVPSAISHSHMTTVFSLNCFLCLPNRKWRNLSERLSKIWLIKSCFLSWNRDWIMTLLIREFVWPVTWYLSIDWWNRQEIVHYQDTFLVFV